MRGHESPSFNERRVHACGEPNHLGRRSRRITVLNPLRLSGIQKVGQGGPEEGGAQRGDDPIRHRIHQGVCRPHGEIHNGGRHPLPRPSREARKSRGVAQGLQQAHGRAVRSDWKGGTR